MAKSLEGNNGFLRSQIISEQREPSMIDGTDVPITVAPTSLQLGSQVNYGHSGSTTINVVRSSTRRSIGIFGRTTSITGRGRSPVNRYQLISILAILLLAMCVFTLLFTFNTSRECVQESYPNMCLTEECVRTAASLLSAMDRSAAPCTDFFQYACGAWNRLHVIPEDRSSVSTFEVLADQLQVILKGLLEEPPDHKDSNATLKAKLFYKSCMDIRGYNENMENYDDSLLQDSLLISQTFIYSPYLLNNS